MKKWKQMTMAAVLSFTALGSVFAGSEIQPVAAAANAVPSYEVKFIAKPEAVLTSNGHVQEDVIQKLGLNSSPQAIGVAYYDTDQLELNEQGWDVRFRKKEDKNNYELTYKKRYPIINGDIDAALSLANKEGFDASDDNYEAEIDWGYGKQTLSFSNTKKVNTNAAGTQMPSEQESLALLLDKLPGKLEKWSSKEWGKQKLSQSRIYGPLTFYRYEGNWEDQELTLEVWPIRNSEGTGIENLIEISFKTDDRETATRLRSKLMDTLTANNWLLPVDGLKTQLILERY
ncbi:hypothetical protein OIN60_02840 [Paenibacillus sp. P96]|uniref:CYTH domain-containing protein n=1 Tax=Paenibacillus zeirhizosphaerae TaxID=2987519 RepID=A0ABT9FMG7_9BACL|nr:hypothetical protein [Paenibacillus sp. P96]MDP4095726.1 hypothetical protein [Paenibacillus sp. P96]